MCLAAGAGRGEVGDRLGESMAVCQIESRVGPMNGTFNSSTETDRGRKRERGEGLAKSAKHIIRNQRADSVRRKGLKPALNQGHTYSMVIKNHFISAV